MLSLTMTKAAPAVHINLQLICQFVASAGIATRYNVFAVTLTSMSWIQQGWTPSNATSAM